ncbi:DMT family transporter [Alphaproteobacteria bacterium]|nr:DMT family transporter [Alphaproteobacteria bacterium]
MKPDISIELPKTPKSNKSKIFLGAFCMIITMMIFSMGNAFIKEVGEENHVMQIVFFRCVWVLVCLVGYMLATKKLNLLRTKKLGYQLLRGFIGFFSMYAMFYSFDALPLTDSTVLVFASPLFITALSYPLLKEKVGLKRWVAVLIGFLGVFIMAHPSGKVTLLGVSAGLLSAFLEAIVANMARMLSKTDNPVTTVFYHTFVIAVISAVFVPFFWQPIGFENYVFLLILGTLAAVGQVFLVYAYSLAPSSVVAPLLYTLIIWTSIIGYFRWGETLGKEILFGAPFVIGAGIYIVYQAAHQKKAA